MSIPEILQVMEKGIANDEALLNLCKALNECNAALDEKVKRLERELDQLKDQVHELNNKVFQD